MRPIKRKFIDSKSKKVRVGAYHGSDWHGGEHAIGIHIDVDHVALDRRGLTPEQMLVGCLAYLSIPPPKKPRARKIPKPKYGELKPCPEAAINLKIDEQGPFISTVVFSSRGDVKAFWK